MGLQKAARPVCLLLCYPQTCFLHVPLSSQDHPKREEPMRTLSTALNSPERRSRNLKKSTRISSTPRDMGPRANGKGLRGFVWRRILESASIILVPYWVDLGVMISVGIHTKCAYSTRRDRSLTRVVLLLASGRPFFLQPLTAYLILTI